MAKTRLDLTVLGLDDEFLIINKQKPDAEDIKRGKHKLQKNIKLKEGLDKNKKEIDILKEVKRKEQQKRYYYISKLKKETNLEKVGLIEDKLEAVNKQLSSLNVDIIDNIRKQEGRIALINDNIEDSNYLLNKDFNFVIRDGFNKPYNLKKPKGTSNENTTRKILQKYTRGMKEALKRTHYKSGKEVTQKTKDTIQWLIDNAKYNLDFLKQGYSEDEWDSDEYYPLKVHFVEREIEINF